MSSGFVNPALLAGNSYELSYFSFEFSRDLDLLAVSALALSTSPGAIVIPLLA